MLEVIGDRSMLRLINKVSTFERVLRYRLFLLNPERTPCGGSGKDHCLVPEPELLKLQKNGQFPYESVRIKV